MTARLKTTWDTEDLRAMTLLPSFQMHFKAYFLVHLLNDQNVNVALFCDISDEWQIA